MCNTRFIMGKNRRQKRDIKLTAFFVIQLFEVNI